MTVAPVADARVLEANPTTNYGSLSRLDVDNPGEQSYLRFAVNGVSGTVQRATLRFFVRNGSSNGPSLYRTSATWTEAAITWNNRPPPTSGAIANLGTATSGLWSEYDLTGQITGNGTYDFVLLPDSTDGVQFDSREGASPPQLVLTVGDGVPVNAAAGGRGRHGHHRGRHRSRHQRRRQRSRSRRRPRPRVDHHRLHGLHHAEQRGPHQQRERHLPLHPQRRLHRPRQLHLPDLRHPRVL